MWMSNGVRRHATGHTEPSDAGKVLSTSPPSMEPCVWTLLLHGSRKCYENSLVKPGKTLYRGTEMVYFQYFNFPSITVQRNVCVEMLLQFLMQTYHVPAMV